MATETVRCPICHRRAPISQGRLQPHDAGSQQCSGTGCHVRTRKPFEIAESVLRDCRYQDDVRGVNETCTVALARWRASGERLVLAALDLLDLNSAASIYALDGVRGGARDIAEERALLRAAGKAA